MSEDKRALLSEVFAGRSADRVPVGFWFHFLHPEYQDALKNPQVVKANLDGHKKFFDQFKPDFVKLMSDGYFSYPAPQLLEADSIEVLRSLEPIGRDHKWITEQGELVKKQLASFSYKTYTFYNIFSPATLLKFLLGNYTFKGNKRLADFILEDKEAVKHALAVISQDFCALAELSVASGADGIYLSVQNVQDERITKQLYDEVIAPSELRILEAVSRVSSQNILHICGYEGVKNKVEWYRDYPASIINFASDIEGVSLAEAKKIFAGKAIIGGFGNTKKDVLFSGTEQEVKAETRRIIKEAGRERFILGADCTLPYDIDLAHLEWVRQAASEA